MTTFEIASLATSAAIGLGQNGIVWYGIRAMNRSSEERAKDRQTRARALDALIRQSDASAAALRELVSRSTQASN